MPVEPNPYDRPDLLDIRKNQDDPIILYLIVRESLNMGVGKIGVQIGHGVMMFKGQHEALISDQAVRAARRAALGVFEAEADENDWKIKITREWLQTSYRKVVLRADDKEWEQLKEQLWCFVVKDAGLTEVAAGSETVVVLWPMRKSAAPKIVKRLQALK